MEHKIEPCINCSKEGSKVKVVASNGRTTRTAIADNPKPLGKVSLVKVAPIFVMFTFLFGDLAKTMFEQNVIEFINNKF